MEIPIQNPTSPDIFSYGFDKSLNRTPSNAGTIVYNQISDAVDMGAIIQGGNLVVKSLTTAGFAKVVAPGDDIQSVIDAVRAAGGGTILFRNGTYIINKDIVLYSNIKIVGESISNTIIDFNNGPYQLRVEGTLISNAGTVSVTNNSQTVIGNTTSWLSTIQAGQSIMLAGIWYPIYQVIDNTTLVIALPFGDTDISGAACLVANIVQSVLVETMTIKNSTLAGLKIQYAGRQIQIQFVDIFTSVTGIDLDDIGQCVFNSMNINACYTGINASNVHYWALTAIAVVDTLVSHGMIWNNVTSTKFDTSFILNSAGDGINLTNCADMILVGVFSQNGINGINLVSGNSIIAMGPARIEDNAGDGVKFTASSNQGFLFNSDVSGNGGYGVNIAASSDNNNIIVGNYIDGNSTGAINDLGTGTVISANVPAFVNPLSQIIKSYTASESIALGDTVSISSGDSYLLATSTVETNSDTITSSTWFSQSFTTSAAARTIFTVKTKINNTGANATITASIRANSGGSPTGADIGVTATATSTGGTNAVITLTFATPVAVSPSTIYHVCFRSSGANTAILRDNSAGQGANTSANSGSTWGTNNGPLYYEIDEVDGVVGQIYKSDASLNYSRVSSFIGFAKASITSGNSGSVIIGGEVVGLSGLVPGVQYFLSDTAGAISSSAGSVNHKIGLATSTTSLLLANQI